MISKLIDFCLRERLVVLALVVAAILYGWYSTHHVPLDAIPDVSENQVIVLAEWLGRSPKDVEDQITYPLSVAMQTVPGARSVRGTSMFGFSFVQVTFHDSIDFYWARSRVAERMTALGDALPEGVVPVLAPDATALGQIYYYVLEPPPGMDLAELRSRQDFFIKFALQSVEGVSEVASIGGYVRQYQIEVDPDRLRYHDVPLSDVIQAVRESNIDVGAKTVETGGMEFLVRGRGFIGSGKTIQGTIEDIENTVILTRDGIPVRVRDVAQVQTGPAFRDGALDLNGQEVVGGVVVMRYRENPRAVIQRVEERIRSLEAELDGIKIHGIYDRSILINETVATLTDALSQQVLITIVVVLLFLLHVRASLVVAITLPIAVLMAYIGMNVFDVDANIMSLAGIAIAIGTMVDMGIIVSENIYRHLSEWEADGSPGGKKRRLAVIREGAGEVIPAVITAVSTTVISFLPVFFLTGRDYKLFAPLAWTKSFAMLASLILAVVLVPLLCRALLVTVRWPRLAGLASALPIGGLVGLLTYFVWGQRLEHWTTLSPPWTAAILSVIGFVAAYCVTRENVKPVEQNPLSRLIVGGYEPLLRFLLAHKRGFMTCYALLVLLGLGAWFGLPTVLQPIERAAAALGADLNAVPGYVRAKHVFTGLRSDDWIALDEGSWFYMPSLYPAGSFNQTMEVLQTQDAMIKQIPEVENVLGKIGRVASALDPAPVQMIETYVMLKPRDQWRPGMTERKIWDEINAVATLPGIPMASPLQPIEGRVVMLQAGIRAAMAVRIYGDSLEGLGKAAREVAEHLRELPQVNRGTVSPDIVVGKPYLEFEVDRQEAARYGMTTAMVNQVVAAGLGGLDVTTTVEGRERYPIQVRYQRSVREHIDQLGEVPVVTPVGAVVPLQRLAHISSTWGPGMIRSEDARLVAHVIFSPSGVVGALETVDAVMDSLRTARADGGLVFPEGNFELRAVGSFQNQVEANRRLMWLIPMVILINLLLIYLQFRNLPISMLVFTEIPTAFAGGMIAIALADVQMNTAVWVGFIALFGIAVDDGVVMATYLDQVFKRRRLTSIRDIRNATVEAGLKRIRPCLMTTATTLVALLPILLATGRGADVARAMALPVFGGMCMGLITFFVVPVLYCGYKELKMRAGLHDPDWEAQEQPTAAAVRAA